MSEPLFKPGMATKELGYLIIDQRASGDGVFESSTYTCTHCEAIVIMNPERQRERTRCHGCRHWICDRCAAVYAQNHLCLTFRQIAEEAVEAAARGDVSGTPLVLKG